jgi:cytochrome P450
MTLGSTITLQQLHDNPYPLFQKLLADEPVSWVPELNMWLGVRYEDVVQVLHDWQTFGLESEHSLIADTLGPMMLSMDGAAQQRLRVPFATPFRPKPLRRTYAQTIADITNLLIDEFVAAGTADLHTQFSTELALLTVTTVLGFPIADRASFHEWYRDLAAAIGNVLGDPAIRERGQQAFAHFHRYVIGVLEQLKRQPDESVLGQMVASADNDLTMDELVSNTAITFFGGLETTAALLSNTLWCLLTHPADLARLQADESLWANAVEEVLRWEAPVQTAHRLVKVDTAVQGIPLHAGQMVQCMLSAANRDLRIFTQPDRFDIDRINAAKHLSFARGPHFCFGAPLARLEATIGLPILLSQLPHLRLRDPAASRPVGHEFRCPPSLWTEWDA